MMKLCHKTHVEHNIRTGNKGNHVYKWWSKTTTYISCIEMFVVFFISRRVNFLKEMTRGEDKNNERI